MEHSFPFGIFSMASQKKRVATRFGGQIVDLYALSTLGYFDGLGVRKSVFQREFLNDFISLGKAKTNAIRARLQEVFGSEANVSALQKESLRVFYAPDEVTMHLPVKIGDYTDFYSSEQHAYNVGVMFRDPAKALLPNWKHLPVAYHGRASSIFVSGTNFHRPKGQLNASDETAPVFSATKRLDIELEMATIIGKENPIGQSVKVNEAEEYVFGFALFNDWSARDIQRWEYVPLGPFLAKNFFSSMGAWVIPIEDLMPFRVPAEAQNPPVLPYLQQVDRHHFDVILEVILRATHPQTGMVHEQLITTSNFKHLYWTVAQQVAHHTVNGCNLHVGDVMASGTISGKTPDSYGSLLELTWGGKNTITLAEGLTRTFLEDGDTVIIRGYAQRGAYRVDFGEVRATVLPAL